MGMDMSVINGIIIGVAVSGIVGFITNYMTRGTALHKLVTKMDLMVANLDEIRRRVAAIELKVHGFTLNGSHSAQTADAGDD